MTVYAQAINIMDNAGRGVGPDDVTVRDTPAPKFECDPFLTINVGPVSIYLDDPDDLAAVIAKLTAEHERVMQARAERVLLAASGIEASS